MDQPYKNVISVVLALLMGCVTGGLSLEAGRSAYEGHTVRPYASVVRSQMEQVVATVEAYRRKHGVVPTNLVQLDKDSKNVFSIGNDGVAHGEFETPFVYQVHGGSYTIICYGRDGKPGGTGDDADFTSDDLHRFTQGGTIEWPTRSRLTMKQYLAGPEVREMVYTAFAAGVVTFLLALFVIRPDNLTRRNLLQSVLGVIGILVVTVILGGIITALHVPSGH